MFFFSYLSNFIERQIPNKLPIQIVLLQKHFTQICAQTALSNTDLQLLNILTLKSYLAPPP